MKTNQQIVIVSSSLMLISFSEALRVAFNTVRTPLLNNLSYILTAVTILIGVITWTKYFGRTISSNNQSDKYFYFLLAYSILLLVVGIILKPNNIVTILFNPYAFPALLLVIHGYISGRLITKYKLESKILVPLRIVISFTILFNIISIAFPLINLIISDISVKLLYILLLYVIVKPNKFDWYLIILGLTLFILSSFNADVRTNFIFIILLICFVIFKFYFTSSFKLVKIIYILGVIVFTIFTFFSEDILNVLLSDNLVKSSVSSSNTRTFLYEEFFESYSNLLSFDFILGRGLMGTYYSDYFFQIYGTENQGDFYQRFTIEVGFLEIILKCGVIFLLVYISIIFLILKNNRLSLSYPTIIIYCLFLLMFIEFNPSFSIRYYIFWLLIGYQSSKLNSAKKIKVYHFN